MDHHLGGHPRHHHLHLGRPGVWSVRHAFALAEIVGVLALAVVGFGTAGGPDRPAGRRILYIGALVLVGVFIVVLEAVVHVLLTHL